MLAVIFYVIHMRNAKKALWRGSVKREMRKIKITIENCLFPPTHHHHHHHHRDSIMLVCAICEFLSAA
jgi:hypothetical protein